MVSRPIALSMLMAATVAASTTSPRSLLRASPSATASAADSTSSRSSADDIPSLSDSRARTRRRLIDTSIDPKCYATLRASANSNEKVKKENYYVFTNIMSNGYYSENNMNEYNDLDMKNKFGYVTLTCQCHAQGGAGNCCQGDRAKLDVTGIGGDPEDMSEELVNYIEDICRVTMDSIGENVRPPTGELPTTASPTRKPSAAPTHEPTASPTENDIPAVVVPPGGNKPGNGNGGGDDDGLSGGAWAGIAIAAACVTTLLLYAMSPKKSDEDTEDDDLSEMGRIDNGKELLAITANGELDPDAPPRMPSPDATNSMTMSDVSSIPSMNTGDPGANASSNYYASNNLLPGRPDEESQLSSSDGPSFFETDSEADTMAGDHEGVEIAAFSSLLNTSSSTTGNESLDQAIENGNWEAVAASAAAIVKQNEQDVSMSTTSTGMEV